MPHDEGSWLAYLRQLRERGGEDWRTQAHVVHALWLAMKQIYTDDFPVPCAATHDDGALELMWETDVHQFELELQKNLSASWIYRNRRTGDVDSGFLQRVFPLNRHMSDRLRLVGGKA